jgi:hypothetical protein
MLIVNRYWKAAANYIHALISIARKHAMQILQLVIDQAGWLVGH